MSFAKRYLLPFPICGAYRKRKQVPFGEKPLGQGRAKGRHKEELSDERKNGNGCEKAGIWNMGRSECRNEIREEMRGFGGSP